MADNTKRIVDIPEVDALTSEDYIFVKKEGAPAWASRSLLPDQLVVDTDFSITSKNPIQNKVITKKLNNIATFGEPINLWDITFTEDHILKKFWNGGKPYEAGTTFDSTYSATEKIWLLEYAPEDDDTALKINMERGKTYRFQYIPNAVYGSYDHAYPWEALSSAGTSNCIWFYDENDTYLGHGGITKSKPNITTVPAEAVYFRFQVSNYGSWSTTAQHINSKMMVTEGENAWTEYYPPTATTGSYLNPDLYVKSGQQIYYNFDGTSTLNVISHYTETKDLRVCMKKRGPNSIFDFSSFHLVSTPLEGKTSSDITGGTTLMTWGTDSRSPFQVLAIENIDGDNLKEDGSYNSYFTGGNHAYDNTGSTSAAPTGRTGSIRIYADGHEVISGSGYAQKLRICWDNYVQGWNTTKADGTGREILREVHEVIFDGISWEETVHLYPLEKINLILWYGLQASKVSSDGVYNESVMYAGGTGASANHLINASGEATNSGSKDTHTMILQGTEHELRMSIDPNYGLGCGEMNKSNSYNCFTTSYGKVYFSIISGTNNLEPNTVYSLRGSYTFAPRSL